MAADEEEHLANEQLDEPDVADEKAMMISTSTLEEPVSKPTTRVVRLCFAAIGGACAVKALAFLHDPLSQNSLAILGLSFQMLAAKILLAGSVLFIAGVLAPLRFVSSSRVCAAGCCTALGAFTMISATCFGLLAPGGAYFAFGRGFVAGNTMGWIFWILIPAHRHTEQATACRISCRMCHMYCSPAAPPHISTPHTSSPSHPKTRHATPYKPRLLRNLGIFTYGRHRLFSELARDTHTLIYSSNFTAISCDARRILWASSLRHPMGVLPPQADLQAVPTWRKQLRRSPKPHPTWILMKSGWDGMPKGKA